MKKILYITANPKEEKNSYSLSVGKEFLKEYRKHNPKDKIKKIDLYKIEIPLIDIDVLNAFEKIQHKKNLSTLTKNEKEKIYKIYEFTDEFISSDKYILVTPMWNLSIPPKMRTYIDTICIAGKTFKYTEKGEPLGLLDNKKALHIHARGGIYSKGIAKNFEFADNFIKGVFTLMGITNFQSLIIEGMEQMPNKAHKIKENAIKNAIELAKTF